MKKVLIISYSQAGQTQRAIAEFTKGLEKNLHFDQVHIVPEEKFKFPWKMTEFFRAFPRCAQGLAPSVERLNIQWNDYDLIILGYQVWFLAPSLPIQGFLQSTEAKELRGKNIITILTCRNLWHSATQTMSQALKKIGANHLGQITICETSPLWASFVTTPRWMLTGNKSAFAFFPPAGISDSEFDMLKVTGQEIGRSWATHGAVAPVHFGSNLNRLSLKLMDAVGYKFFKIWSRFILNVAPKSGFLQDSLLLLFRVNLIFLIISIGPCTKIIEWISVRTNIRNNSKT